MQLRKVFFGVSVIIFLAALGRFLYIRNATKSRELNVKEVRTNLTTTAKFSEIIKNMGVGKLNVPVIANFVIYNTGSQDLYIQRIEPDCHCTSVDFSHAKIPPNDSSVIKLVYNASNEGPYQSTAMATTNSDRPTTLLIFRGTINPN